jgi:hypothetical protein
MRSRGHFLPQFFRAPRFGRDIFRRFSMFFCRSLKISSPFFQECIRRTARMSDYLCVIENKPDGLSFGISQSNGSDASVRDVCTSKIVEFEHVQSFGFLMVIAGLSR